MLQQANEKVAKGLLLSTGILTPKQLAGDWRTRHLIGFAPNESKDYGHLIVPSLLSDADKVVPSLEGLFQLVNTGEFKPQMTRMKKIVRESGEGVELLRKLRLELVSTEQQLDREIEGATMILDRIGVAVSAMRAELGKLNQSKVSVETVKAVRKMGFRVRWPTLQKQGPLSTESFRASGYPWSAQLPWR